MTTRDGGLGVTAAQQRIAAIRRQMAMFAAGGPTAAATGGNAPTNFADYLNQASGSLAAATTASGTSLDSTSSTGANGATSGGRTPAVDLLDATARATATAAAARPAKTPALNTVRPSELPPVPITGAMRAAGNGQLPDTMLSPIGDGHQLAEPAASAFTAMRQDAARAGISFGVNDGYRSYDEQVQLAAAKGIYGQGGWAAVPGTSNHGWGLATDLDLDDSAQAWMRDNGWRYGFFEDVPNEPWHWTYRSSA